MSKSNKVNPDHYNQRGRLMPDDAARERSRQRQAAGGTPPARSTARTATAPRTRTDLPPQTESRKKPRD